MWFTRNGNEEVGPTVALPMSPNFYRFAEKSVGRVLRLKISGASLRLAVSILNTTLDLIVLKKRNTSRYHTRTGGQALIRASTYGSGQTNRR